jgi:hypothetical protein
MVPPLVPRAWLLSGRAPAGRSGPAVCGQLIYEIPGYYLDKIEQPIAARLEVWDHSTDRRMQIPAEVGSFETSDMSISAGGAQLIEPGPAGAASRPGDASA